jgi:hypothetical protein
VGFWKATDVDPGDLGPDFMDILCETEEALRAYKSARDYFVFTNQRLVLVDKQGLTGRKVDYHSIPYRTITHFSVESAGRLDRDVDLKVWVSGSDKPIEKDLGRGVDIKALLRTLAEHTL